MEVVKKHTRPGMTIDHTIQTNGTKLDDAWCESFYHNNFLVGLYLDSSKEMHDAYKEDKAGDGTFDHVLAVTRLLQRHRYGWQRSKDSRRAKLTNWAWVGYSLDPSSGSLP